jgi:ABC-type proline/glycine betaine transport system ATPase subunit
VIIEKNLLHVMDGILNKTLTTHDLQEACKVSDKVLEDVKEDIKKRGNS